MDIILLNSVKISRKNIIDSHTYLNIAHNRYRIAIDIIIEIKLLIKINKVTNRSVISCKNGFNLCQCHAKPDPVKPSFSMSLTPKINSVVFTGYIIAGVIVYDIFCMTMTKKIEPCVYIT